MDEEREIQSSTVKKEAIQKIYKKEAVLPWKKVWTHIEKKLIH